jgi:hypothetical protein
MPLGGVDEPELVGWVIREVVLDFLKLYRAKVLRLSGTHNPLTV